MHSHIVSHLATLFALLDVWPLLAGRKIWWFVPDTTCTARYSTGIDHLAWHVQPELHLSQNQVLKWSEHLWWRVWLYDWIYTRKIRTTCQLVGSAVYDMVVSASPFTILSTALSSLIPPPTLPSLTLSCPKFLDKFLAKLSTKLSTDEVLWTCMCACISWVLMLHVLPLDSSQP